MKTVRWMMGVAVVGFCLSASRGFAQGSLTPPGAPAPTMKTLAQVEPRIPITNAPFTISQPGSYYLTTNLSTTGDGVVIQAARVTLDLMGFSITGDGGTGDYGIHVSGTSNAMLSSIAVRGGAVSGFDYGVRLDYAQNSRVEGMTMRLSTYGLYLRGTGGQCKGNEVRDCIVSDNTGYGIYLAGGSGGRCSGNTIRNCTLVGNDNFAIYLSGGGGECNGNTIRDCAFSGNLSTAIYLSGGGAGQCNGNTVQDCAISGNGGNGILLNGQSSGQVNRNTIARCTISDNGATGIKFDGTSSGNCSGNTVRECNISASTDKGVALAGNGGACNGNTVAECKVSDNGDQGIHLYGPFGECDGNTVANCHVSGHPSVGIDVFGGDGNRIENNHVSGTNYGIQCYSSTNNLIVRNFSVGHDVNYAITTVNTIGPYSGVLGTLSTTNGAAGLSPWANFFR